MTATVASRPRSEKKAASGAAAPAKRASPAKRPGSAKKAATRNTAKPQGSRSARRSISSAGLFVVDFAALRSRTRRRRMVIVSLILLVGAFFGVALVQAQLVQTQSDLDRLQQEISVLENDIALLDRSVVVASSPEEIVRRAKALGMVRSVRPVYLVATRPLSP
ncbi:MAG: septum formation initiator family protein [Acidimicrobiales bacterium]|nr:septum formation initiator family protein [Acidimicrobiales bacterium]